jgi:hypothetical protein
LTAENGYLTYRSKALGNRAFRVKREAITARGRPAHLRNLALNKKER